jgi:hypothetical protein
VQVVLPTPHRKSHVRQTPVSIGSLARAAWRRPSSRDLVFAPLPFRRVFSAWLAIAVVIRVNEAIRLNILVPAFGQFGEVLGTVLSIVSVLAVTQPFFRSYAGQWPEVLGWYGFVLASLTILCETLFQLYVQHLFGHEVLARYNILRGELWTLVVITVGMTPLVWARWSQS